MWKWKINEGGHNILKKYLKISKSGNVCKHPCFDVVYPVQYFIFTMYAFSLALYFTISIYVYPLLSITILIYIYPALMLPSQYIFIQHWTLPSQYIFILHCALPTQYIFIISMVIHCTVSPSPWCSSLDVLVMFFHTII